MAQPLKKEEEQVTVTLPVKPKVIREASRKASRTIDTLTDKLSREIAEEVLKEEADNASSRD